MGLYSVTTSSDQDKALSYALDSYNVGKIPITLDEYVQLIFQERVVQAGSLEFFEDKAVADAYEAADQATQDQVDTILGVEKK